MRYGNPSIAEPHRGAAGRRAATASCWCRSIRNTAAATTATACDKAFDALMEMRWQPAVRVAPPCHDDPVYIDALADSHARAPRRARLRAGGDRSPPSTACRRSYLLQGRPLSLPVRRRPARLLREALGWPAERCMVCLPVALRHDGMAAALHRRDRGGAGRRGREDGSPSSRRASPPTAWRRWRRSTSRTARSSCTTAARSSPTSPASTTARTACA